jgi:hypothetical protein
MAPGWRKRVPLRVITAKWLAGFWARAGEARHTCARCGKFAPMARSASPFLRLRQRVAAYRWRRVGVLAGSSLALSLALVLYLFGVGDHFFGRLFSTFFVWFWLLAVTFLGVVPFISWASDHWFGPSWQGQEAPPMRRPARPATAAPKVTSRRSSTSST